MLPGAIFLMTNELQAGTVYLLPTKRVAVCKHVGPTYVTFKYLEFAGGVVLNLNFARHHCVETSTEVSK